MVPVNHVSCLYFDWAKRFWVKRSWKVPEYHCDDFIESVACFFMWGSEIACVEEEQWWFLPVIKRLPLRWRGITSSTNDNKSWNGLFQIAHIHLTSVNTVLPVLELARMHSSRMRTRPLIGRISVSRHIPRMPPGSNHACPPRSNHACPPGVTMHAPPGATTHTTPRSNHTRPPGATMHTPQSNHACPPWEQPCMPSSPRATTHTPCVDKIVDTHSRKYYLAPTSLRAATTFW